MVVICDKLSFQRLTFTFTFVLCGVEIDSQAGSAVELAPAGPGPRLPQTGSYVMLNYRLQCCCDCSRVEFTSCFGIIL